MVTRPLVSDAATDPVLALEGRAARGDRDALGSLVREHARAVYELCHHVSGPSDGKDAAQEALERIVTSVGRFDPARGRFRGWALTVARNVCRDRLRRRGLERATFDSDGEATTERARSHRDDPEHQTLLRADARALARALETLPENLRTALVLFHVSEASYDEIAKTLDVPIGTVMTWLHRGRARLRAALAAEQGT